MDLAAQSEPTICEMCEVTSGGDRPATQLRGDTWLCDVCAEFWDEYEDRRAGRCSPDCDGICACSGLTWADVEELSP